MSRGREREKGRGGSERERTDELDRFELERLAAPGFKVFGRIDGKESSGCDEGLFSEINSIYELKGRRRRGGSTHLIALTWNVYRCELRGMVLLQSRREEGLEESVVVEEESNICKQAKGERRDEMSRRARKEGGGTELTVDDVVNLSWRSLKDVFGYDLNPFFSREFFLVGHDCRQSTGKEGDGSESST